MYSKYMVIAMSIDPISYKDFHPEDIKAAIRREFGTVLKFEKHHGLPSTGVSDVLRDKSHNKKTIGAIEAVLTDRRNSINLEVSSGQSQNHRLNSEAA